MKAIAILLAVSFASQEPAAQMSTIRIVPDRDEYSEYESVTAAIEIHNAGPATIEIPEPFVYRIEGPSFPEPKQFNSAPANIQIEPGATWQGAVLLTQLLGPLAPGEYTLSAAFAFQGATAQSPERRIRISPASISSVHIAQGIRRRGRAEGRVVYFNRSATGSALSAFRFNEARPDIGEINTIPPVAQFKAGPQATDIAAVWPNTTVFQEFLQWTAWREGNDIKVVSDGSTEALSLTLPAAPSFLVRPALKLKAKPVEVLVVASDRHLYLGSFPADFDPKARPKLVWRVPLPAQPLAAIARLAPEGNDARHIAFAAANGDALEIYHASFKDAAPGRFQSARIPNVELVPNSTLAIIIDSSGTARISLLARSSGGKTYSAVEAEFKSSGAGQPEILPLGDVAEPVESGAILYIEHGDKAMRRDIALVAGKVLRRWMQNSKTWKLFPPGQTPAHPLILVGGENYGYVLCHDAERGFYFDSL